MRAALPTSSRGISVLPLRRAPHTPPPRPAPYILLYFLLLCPTPPQVTLNPRSPKNQLIGRERDTGRWGQDL